MGNRNLLLFIVLAGLALLAAPRPAVAQPRCAESWARDGLHLAGRLGETDIRAYLHTGYPSSAEEDGVSGVFFYQRSWTPGRAGTAAEFSLDGRLTDDCQMQLTDSRDSGGDEHGIWRLHFVTSQRLEGTWESPAGRSVAVSLRVVAPTDCSGRGVWRKFSSPRWPITFDYPVSWRLAQEDDRVILQCPDASSLAWGGAPIVFELGTGRENVEAQDGRRGTRIARFLTFADDEWLIGDESCERPAAEGLSALCDHARKSTWRGMTVLQGSAGEHRRYRPGAGYVGQGPGIVSYLLLLDASWVAIGSEAPSERIDQMGSRGPVLFGGSGVTERIVRSITRR